MQQLRWLFKVSRPRFWAYLFGPFLIGIAAFGRQDVMQHTALLASMALYFTFPANLLVYGINDIHDYETDKQNPKKKHYEALVKPSDHQLLYSAMALSNLPFITMFMILPSAPFAAKASLVLFMFFGLGYSMPPIRAKVRPFVDTLFNSLYVFPALVSYGILADAWPPLALFIAATAWCMAMHAYSAIPDISSDKKARIRTVATVLGAQGTLVFCSVCYVVAGVFSYNWLGVFGLLIMALYIGIMLHTARKGAGRVFALYKLFPKINLAVGFMLFWYIVLLLGA
jgi:4-hydroxybenzoate polyprenyltransferase